MRILGLASLLAMLACTDSTGTGGSNDLNLAGTWTGTLTLTVASATFTSSATLTLTHAAGAVGGSLVFGTDVNDPLIADGTLSGSALSLTLTPVQSASDDCHLYPVTMTFTAATSSLTATGASGQVCDGNGVGGHESLEALTGVSGTLTR